MSISDAHFRISLKALIYEVGSLFTPARWNTLLLDSNLMRQYFVAVYLSCIRCAVGSSARHTLISYSTNGKYIASFSMGKTLSNFWCHITKSTAHLFARSAWLWKLGETKVDKFQVTFDVKYEVLGLDIPVDNFFGMDSGQSLDETRYKKSGGLHIERIFVAS